ncbi:unnamed protein product [Closterium sp. NIES-53]
MLAGIAKYYYWPGMATDVQQFVTSCDTCQWMKSSKQKKLGLLQPLPVLEQPWQVVSLDFITGLLSPSRGHGAILVVIDKFSNATTTPEATARLFFDRIITIHDILATLISCRDPKFMSKDQVLLDTRNLNMSHLPSKLWPRYCGPFHVEAQVTPVTFRFVGCSEVLCRGYNPFTVSQPPRQVSLDSGGAVAGGPGAGGARFERAHVMGAGARGGGVGGTGSGGAGAGGAGVRGAGSGDAGVKRANIA